MLARNLHLRRVIKAINGTWTSLICIIDGIHWRHQSVNLHILRKLCPGYRLNTILNHGCTILLKYNQSLWTQIDEGGVMYSSSGYPTTTSEDCYKGVNDVTIEEVFQCYVWGVLLMQRQWSKMESFSTSLGIRRTTPLNHTSLGLHRENDSITKITPCFLDTS